jgi:hypothetical protein
MMGCSVAELLGEYIPPSSDGVTPRIPAKEIPEWNAYWEYKNMKIEEAQKRGK